MHRLFTSLRHFNELVMFQHSIFSLPFIFIAMIVSADGWFTWRLLFLGILAAVSARNFAMGLNRYADREIDAKNPRTQNRPSVDGRISSGAVLAFTLLNAFAFLLVAYFVNDLAFKLALPILVVLGSYSYFKRFSALTHIILGLSLGLAPIAGVVAVEAAVPLWSLYLSAGVLFWVAGFDLLYSLQDIEFDTKEGLHSVPSRLGANNTFRIARLFHVLTIFFWALFVMEAGLGVFAAIAVLFSALMLGYEHYLVNKDFSKIDRAFFTVNGYLGIIFIGLIIIEKALT